MKRIIIAIFLLAALLVPAVPAQAAGLSGHRAKVAMRHYLKHNRATLAFYGRGAVTNHDSTRPRIVGGSCDSDAHRRGGHPAPDPTVDANHDDDYPPTYSDPAYEWNRADGEGHWTGYRDTPDPDHSDDAPPTLGQTGYSWSEIPEGSGQWSGVYYPNWPSAQGSQAVSYTDPTRASHRGFAPYGNTGEPVVYQDPTLDTNHDDDHLLTPIVHVRARNWWCRAWWRVGYTTRRRTVCVDGVCVVGRERGRLECTMDLRAHGIRHVRVAGTRPDCTMYDVN